jgi:hypothetical protein
MPVYRIFDTAIESGFPLTGLDIAGSGEIAAFIRQCDPGTINATHFARAFEWRTKEGDLLHYCERRDEEYLFTFPGRVTYHIAPDGVISCMPASGSGAHWMGYLLLNQVVPRFLDQDGKLLLHASAVTLPNGRTLAFAGQTGAGKSTMASVFYQAGARLIDDDCIMLVARDGIPEVWGGTRGIRLHPDTREAVFATEQGFKPIFPGSRKQHLTGLVDEQGSCEVAAPALLDALFLLDEPQTPEQVIQTGIEPMSARDAFLPLVYSAMSMDPSDRGIRERHFKLVANILSAGTRVYRLVYQRDLERLSEICQAVTDYIDLNLA